MNSIKQIMTFDRTGYTDDQLLHIYQNLLKPRLIEEKMLVLLRQGKISKWFSGIGQEAVAVGAAMAMEDDEYMLPMHRNLGVFTTRKVPLSKLFKQFLGKKNGFTNGRDRSFHFGSQEHRIVGMISHLGSQLGVADGVALSYKIQSDKKCTLVFSGDGGSSEGDFHEALNVAAVWDLPVVFVVENNGYGLSTPSSEQFRFKNFIDKGPGYGIKTFQSEGNNVLDTYSKMQEAVDYARDASKPVLFEAMTFRMRGHEEASGTKYVPDELLDYWAERDPVENYEKYLLEIGVLSEKTKEGIASEIISEINGAWKEAENTPLITPDRKEEENAIYNDYVFSQITVNHKYKELRFVDAISLGLKQSMEKHEDLVLMGQDIAEYGGAFKVTEGFVDSFGKERVRNTPLCESVIVGAALGMSVAGHKTMVEMQFADFVSCGFNQIVNNLAKVHYRWGQNADTVIRMPTGGGVGAGPFHSQSNEAWFFHVPGLKIVYPSTPYYAKGLLCEAFNDTNPVMFFEHKVLYRSIKETIPEGYYTIEIGKGRVVEEGTDCSIITYGAGVYWALDILPEFKDHSIEIIDMYSLLPWDEEIVRETVAKTNKVLILHEDSLTGGIGAEWAAWIGEHCFQYLDAPVFRVASMDTPVPFNKKLEEQFMARRELSSKLEALLKY